MIQFPERWFTIISILVVLSSALSINLLCRKNKIFYIILPILIFVLSYSNIKNFIIDKARSNEQVNIAANMNWSDYSYENTSLDYANVINNTLNVKSENVDMRRWEKDGLKVQFGYYLKNSNIKDNKVQVPLLYYPGYEATDDSGNKLEITRDEQNLLNVNLIASKGVVIIDYKGLRHWKYFDVISLISLVIYILLIFKENRILLFKYRHRSFQQK